METIPLGDCVGEYFGVGVAVGRVQSDVELVGEDFFGVAGKEKGEKCKHTKFNNIIF